MESEAVDTIGPHLLQGFNPFSHRIASSDNVIIQNHIPIENWGPNVSHWIEKPILAIISKMFKTFTNLFNIFEIDFIRLCAYENGILNLSSD